MTANHTATRRTKRPTYADIEALPPGVNGEILGGELVVSPRPSPPHVNGAAALGSHLNAAFQLGLLGPGGWWILFEPELALGVDPDFDPVIPDIAGWRFSTMPEQPTTAQYHTPPDWICEVVSPATGRHDRVLKVPFYARAGVRHCWLLDPLAETLEVYRLESRCWTLAGSYGADMRVRAEPFDAIEIDLALVWRRRVEPEGSSAPPSRKR